MKQRSINEFINPKKNCEKTCLYFEIDIKADLAASVA